MRDDRAGILKRRRWLERLSFGGFLIIVGWSALSIDIPDRELHYLKNLWNFITRFFPPNFDDASQVFSAFLETLRIAALATLLGAVVSMALAMASTQLRSILGARWIIKATLNLVRTIPSLVWALLAVAIIGPNVLAGVIALSFYSVGYLAKFFTDAIDQVHLKPVQVLKVSGASGLQAFLFGVIPNLKSLFLSQSLWMFEYNIRSASIIGYVGAGGLGTLLHQYQEYYQWDRFAAVLIVIFVVVSALDTLNHALSRRAKVERN